MHHTKEMPAQPRRRAGLRWVSLVLSMVVLAVLLVVLWGQDQKNVLGPPPTRPSDFFATGGPL